MDCTPGTAGTATGFYISHDAARAPRLELADRLHRWHDALDRGLSGASTQTVHGLSMTPQRPTSPCGGGSTKRTPPHGASVVRVRGPHEIS